MFLRRLKSKTVPFFFLNGVISTKYLNIKRIDSINTYIDNYTEGNLNLPTVLIIGSAVARGLGFNSWAKRLKEDLNIHARVINLSKGGMDTHDTLKRLKYIYNRWAF